MRRKDREVLEEEKIDEIILVCHCCRLGFYDGDKVYIVPMNFGYEQKDGKRIFYFHSAKEGRKIDLISKASSVGFELDTNYQLLEGETPCSYSARYQSIIGTGQISFLTDPQKKTAALQLILLHHTGKNNWEFSEKMLETVCVFQLVVEKLSCKEHG